MISKKAQEEMVGFVLVVVLVAVIFLILIGVFIRRPPAQPQQSTEISQFLSAMMEYTSSCSLDTGFSYKKLGALADDCNSGKTCASGKTACEVLEETSKSLIESSWNFDDSSPTKDYLLTAEFENADNFELTSDNTSECTQSSGADRKIPGKNIILTLKICYN